MQAKAAQRSEFGERNWVGEVLLDEVDNRADRWGHIGGSVRNGTFVPVRNRLDIQFTRLLYQMSRCGVSPMTLTVAAPSRYEIPILPRWQHVLPSLKL
jgi:hypothetical protein